jgi:flagellar L-ring protein precursor FlgH
MVADRVRPLHTLLAVLVLFLGTPNVAPAQTADYDSEYNRYLLEARKTAPPKNAWMVDLASDPKARRQNDLVTIRVVENLSATGSADSNVGERSSANASMPSPAAKWLAKVFPISLDTDFEGAGGTTRMTELTTMVTARVAEVLPNGDLVVEGIREVEINGDRTIVVLTGVVRPADIKPGNVVLSPQVGQLRIRSISRGFIKDSLEPGWLIKVLNKVF